MDLTSKLARDKLCQQWGRSPARLQAWSSAVVRARLTVQQEANRRAARCAPQVPAEGEVGGLSGQWRTGCRVFFAADTTVILTTGHAPFRLPLGLHETSVVEHLCTVLALVPKGELPAVPRHA